MILKDYDVTVLIADYDHIGKKKIRERYPECTYINVPEYKRNLSISRVRSHIIFGKEVGKRLKSLRPDLIFLQLPPNNSAWYCTQYKKLHPETKYYIDLIDLWPESLPLKGADKTLIVKYWKSVRDNSLPAADHVFTECALYRKKLAKVLNREKTSVLYLYKKQTEEGHKLVNQKIKKRRIHSDKLSFAYLGSINNIVDMEGILKVLKGITARGISTSIHIVGDGEGRNRFLKTLKAAGVKVYFYGAVFDQMRKIKILGNCDFAFNMMKESVLVGLTIKSIDYFSMGLPIINNIKGDTWEIVRRYGAGVNVDDPEYAWESILDCDAGDVSQKAYALYLKVFTEDRFKKCLKEAMRL